ncbi:hypothetical protein ZWY2020_000742 [Hordeum vulgare]|nr:hypothetical protein ZWY2020_000742 [Hordeum vulgare]
MADATPAEASSSGDAAGKMITLISSDGESFEVLEEAAAISRTINHMIEDNCVENGVPLPNVTSKILAKVIEYCNMHVPSSSDAADGSGEKDLKSFDAGFIAVDQATLYDLLLAANYLDVEGLLDLCLQTVADMIKGKTVEEIRKTFNIECDFTPEEEAEIKKENQWAFE